MYMYCIWPFDIKLTRSLHVHTYLRFKIILRNASLHISMSIRSYWFSNFKSIGILLQYRLLYLIITVVCNNTDLIFTFAILEIRLLSDVLKYILFVVFGHCLFPSACVLPFELVYLLTVIILIRYRNDSEYI